MATMRNLGSKANASLRGFVLLVAFLVAHGVTSSGKSLVLVTQPSGSIDDRSHKNVTAEVGAAREALPPNGASEHRGDDDPQAAVLHIVNSTATGQSRAAAVDDMDSDGDGCGLVDSRRTQSWAPLSEEEVGELRRVQACLRRTGHPKHATPVGNEEMGLRCNTEVTYETLRSTLSRFDRVWLHGDSVMEQQFYTLACMMNTSVTVPKDSDLGGPKKMRWTAGLGFNGIEKFTYSHARGSTEFIYSRFGRSWGLDSNLFKLDFPMAVKELTPRDAILIDAATHYPAARVAEYERAIGFIAEQSTLAKASVFYMEPTPEEWPTSNGQWTKTCIWRCTCEALDELRLEGRGKFTQPQNETIDGAYSAGEGKPVVPFFQRLYPGFRADLAVSNSTHKCIPNCLPATWRVDYVRSLFLEKAPLEVHIVPTFWQLASKATNTGRGRGDCTHRNLYATTLMNFQWIRTILSQNDITSIK